jgi:hypothetical protein
MSSAVMQILGHFLEITPRFFNISYTMTSIGPTCEECMSECIPVASRLILLVLLLLISFPLPDRGLPPTSDRYVLRFAVHGALS